MRLALILAGISMCLSGCTQTEGSYRFYNNGTRGLVSDSAAVVSAHPVATQIGIKILKQGGNAVDAAVAVQFALAVCYPSAGNIGGGGFAVIRFAAGETKTLDFREKAPLMASRDMYLADGEVIEGLSRSGHLASGVPGSVAGMHMAHRAHGKMHWADVVQPAIDLALAGLALTSKEARKLNAYQEILDSNSTSPSALVRAGDWRHGDKLVQPELALTLTAIRDSGASGFYRGWVADSIVAEMQRGGGIVTHDDLQQYEAIWRQPIEFDYGGYDFISMAPPSSGGIVLQQMLGMIDGQALGEWNDATTVHLLTEVERRAYADRAQHLGDADFYPVPHETLQSTAYLKQRMTTFSADSASSSNSVGAGIIRTESEETTHFSIVDQFGNAVAVTTTLNSGFGGKVVVGGCGFLLNNEMDDFAVKAGAPNLYGLIGSEANAIAPGKRMLSSMTPTIIEKDDNLWMVLGSPGGATIITSVLQTFLNVAEFDMNMPEAVAALKVHHQWRPDTIRIEEGALTEPVIRQLEQMGHSFLVREPIGRVDAIRVLEDGRLECGADPRGDDSCAGF